MANEKRLIAVDDLKRAIWNVDCDVYEFCEGCVTNMGISRLALDDVIDGVPTVDAVEVVRCKDCSFIIDRSDGTHGCYRHFVEDCKIDDFCSYGERKDNESMDG